MKYLRRQSPQITWSWRNWTFGFWTMRAGLDRPRVRLTGIDLGPLEFVWRKSL